MNKFKRRDLNHLQIPSPVLIKEFSIFFLFSVSFFARFCCLTDGRNKELTLHILHNSPLFRIRCCVIDVFFHFFDFYVSRCENSHLLLLRFYWFPYGLFKKISSENERNWVLDDDKTSFVWALNFIWFFNSWCDALPLINSLFFSVFNLLIDFQFNKKP